MARQLRQPLGGPEEISPTAGTGVVDTYTKPQAPSSAGRGMEILESLQKIQPTIAQLSTQNLLEQDETEAREILAELKGATPDESKERWKEMVKEGDVAFGSNPWVQSYVKEQGGILMADKIGSELRAKYLSSPVVEGDAQMVAEWAKAFIEDRTKSMGFDEEDVPSTLGFMERMGSHLTALRNQHLNMSANRRQTEIRAQGTDDIRNFIQTLGYNEGIEDIVDPEVRQSWVKAGKSESEIRRMSVRSANETVAQHIVDLKDEYLKLGVPAREFNTLAAKAIADQAVSAANTGALYAKDILRAADFVSFGKGKPFNQISAVKDILSVAEAKVERVQAAYQRASEAKRQELVDQQADILTDSLTTALLEKNFEQASQILVTAEDTVAEYPEMRGILSDLKDVSDSVTNYRKLSTSITRNPVAYEMAYTGARRGDLPIRAVPAMIESGAISDKDGVELVGLIRQAKSDFNRQINNDFAIAKKTAMSTLSDSMSAFGASFTNQNPQKITQIEGQIEMAFNQKYREVQTNPDLSPSERLGEIRLWMEGFFGPGGTFETRKNAILEQNKQAVEMARSAGARDGADRDAAKARGDQEAQREQETQEAILESAITPLGVEQAIDDVLQRDELIEEEGQIRMDQVEALNQFEATQSRRMPESGTPEYEEFVRQLGVPKKLESNANVLLNSDATASSGGMEWRTFRDGLTRTRFYLRNNAGLSDGRAKEVTEELANLVDLGDRQPRGPASVNHIPIGPTLWEFVQEYKDKIDTEARDIDLSVLDETVSESLTGDFSGALIRGGAVKVVVPLIARLVGEAAVINQWKLAREQ